MSRQHSWILVGAVAAVGASCSSDLNDPAPIRPPAAMELAYGDNQVGVAGSPLAQHITVKVTDEHGTPLRGVTVAFEVTAGGGNLGSPADLTDTEGFARAAWTLGSEPGIGTQQATATIAGTSIAPVTFSARAASQLVKRGGDAQTAEVLHGVAEAPTVIVRDAADRPVAGMTVHWAVTSGGGRVESPTSLTDADGVASMPWTLGNWVAWVGSVHSLMASIAPELEVTFSATAVLTVGAIGVDAGNNQSGVAGAMLGVPLAIWVVTPNADDWSTPVQGVEVAWEVVGGGGTLSRATSITDASGRARVSWTVGATPGSGNQVVRASVAGLAGSPVTFTASATAGP